VVILGGAMCAAVALSLFATPAAAVGLNSTYNPTTDRCSPPSLDCITVVINSAGVGAGQAAMSDSQTIASSTEAELYSRYEAEFIVAADLL